jgi:hypothetical protein
MLTLAEAARLAGVSKTTLMRAIRAGRLSATPLDDGGYSIDERQFARVYKVKLESPAIGGGAPRKIGRVEARPILAVSPIALAGLPATPAGPPVFAVAPAPSADLTPAQIVWPSPPDADVDTLEAPASSAWHADPPEFAVDPKAAVEPPSAENEWPAPSNANAATLETPASAPSPVELPAEPIPDDDSLMASVERLLLADPASPPIDRPSPLQANTDALATPASPPPLADAPVDAPVSAEASAESLSAADPPATPVEPSPVADDDLELTALDARIKGLQELLAEVRASRDELRRDRDEWRGQAERLLMNVRRPWWRRLAG